MKLVLPVFAVLATLVGCEASPRTVKPVDVAGQKIYRLTGRILSRSAGDNTVRIAHEAIPGFMAAMTMDFSVRGADVASLPPDGARVEARLHGAGGGYWVSDVKALPDASAGGSP